MQSWVTGTGRSLAAECSAGICHPPTASGFAVPASANAVQDAATPHATRMNATERSSQPSLRASTAGNDLRPPADAGWRSAATRPSTPNNATAIPPMNMTCVIGTSGATW